MCRASLLFRVRVRVLGLGFCVRVRVIVSIMGSGSYLNENSVVFLVFVAPSVECRESYRMCTANSTQAALFTMRAHVE